MADTAQCEGLPCCVIGGSKSLLLVIAFGFLSQFFLGSGKTYEWYFVIL